MADPAPYQTEKMPPIFVGGTCFLGFFKFSAGGGKGMFAFRARIWFYFRFPTVPSSSMAVRGRRVKGEMGSIVQDAQDRGGEYARGAVELYDGDSRKRGFHSMEQIVERDAGQVGQQAGPRAAVREERDILGRRMGHAVADPLAHKAEVGEPCVKSL